MNRHDRRKSLTATVIFLLVLSLAMGYQGYLVADSILENVEVLNFKHAIISVDYDMSLSPGYVDEFDETAMGSRFDIFEHTYSSVTKQEDMVRFTMGEVPRISFNTFTADDQSVEVEFTLHYFPKQFDLISGVFTYGRRLRIVYPSLYTIRVANITRLNLETNFTLIGRRIEMEDFTPDLPESGDLTIGDTLRIKRTGDASGSLKFCVAALTRRSDTDVLVRAFGSSCEKLVLPTQGTLSEVLYDLHLIGVRGDGMGYVVHPVRLSEPPLAIRLTTQRKSVHLGEGLELDVDPAEPLEGCTVKVFDSFWTRRNEIHLQACTHVVVGTSTAWAPGTYILEVEGYHQGLVGKATESFQLLGIAGALPTETKTDKDVYKAGEDVNLFTDAPGDICTVQVFNQDGIRVMEEDSLGCGNAELELDPSLDSGTYTVQTTAYKNNRNVGSSMNMIEVSDWRPELRSAQSEVCEGGFMHVLGATLPCIETGQTCVPSSGDIPLCLCFGKESGDVVDVCEYGRFCGASDCSEQRIKSPFIIIESEGECMAKSGEQTLSCIEIGEICMGTCVCLDREKNPAATCVIGEMCGTDGCAPSALEFSLLEMEPAHVRADVLASEGINLTWKGNVRFEGAVLGDEALAELAANASLHDHDTVDDPTIWRLHGESAGWAINTTFKAQMLPGEYEAFIVVGYRDNIHVLRRPFEVWYPRDESILRLSIKEVDPAKVRPKDFEVGFPLEIDVTVNDMDGGIVVNLPLKAFNLTFGGLEPVSSTPTYNKLSQRWHLASNFMDVLIFTWEDVPGMDSGRLRSYLRRTYGEPWMDDVDISKSNDGRTIILASGDDWVEFALEAGGVTVSTDDGNGHGLSVREEEGEHKVYSALPTEQAITLNVGYLGRKGRATSNVDVVDHVPLEFNIQRASPGNENEPLIHYLTMMGFNLDIFLQLKGSTDVSEDAFRVSIHGKDVTEHIAYLVSTTSGIRLHLSDISLCPNLPAGGSQVELKVVINSPMGGVVERSTQLELRSNPGQYVVGCQG